MGEITDALRRAQKERHRRAQQRSSLPPIEAEEGPSLVPVSPPEAADSAATRAPLEETHRHESDVHVSDSEDRPYAARVVLAQHQGRFAERFRQFALRLVRELESRRTRGVLGTSAVRADGKTTIACNLALALASMAAGRRIALVELDLRRPSICKDLGLTPPPVGFERVLTGEVPLDAACLRSDTGVDLFLIGEPVENAHEILARRELGSVLTELKERYDTTVLDTPPVLLVPDVSLILPYVEACVTVVRNCATPLSAIRSMLDVLPEEKIVGAFLNDAREPRHFGSYDYYSGYHEDPAAE